jgi:hypothetical protein
MRKTDGFQWFSNFHMICKDLLIRVLDFVRFFLGFVFSLMRNLPLPMVSNLNLFFLINVQWLFGGRLHFHSILQPISRGVRGMDSGQKVQI